MGGRKRIVGGPGGRQERREMDLPTRADVHGKDVQGRPLGPDRVEEYPGRDGMKGVCCRSSAGMEDSRPWIRDRTVLDLISRRWRETEPPQLKRRDPLRGMARLLHR